VVAVMRSPFRRLVSGSWMGAVLRCASIAGQEKANSGRGGRLSRVGYIAARGRAVHPRPLPGRRARRDRGPAREDAGTPRVNLVSVTGIAAPT
jgi:hypothetical protein